MSNAPDAPSKGVSAYASVDRDAFSFSVEATSDPLQDPDGVNFVGFVARHYLVRDLTLQMIADVAELSAAEINPGNYGDYQSTVGGLGSALSGTLDPFA